jgi:hypothetical protein
MDPEYQMETGKMARIEKIRSMLEDICLNGQPSEGDCIGRLEEWNSGNVPKSCGRVSDYSFGHRIDYDIIEVDDHGFVFNVPGMNPTRQSFNENDPGFRYIKSDGKYLTSREMIRVLGENISLLDQ